MNKLDADDPLQEVVDIANNHTDPRSAIASAYLELLAPPFESLGAFLMREAVCKAIAPETLDTALHAGYHVAELLRGTRLPDYLIIQRLAQVLKLDANAIVQAVARCDSAGEAQGPLLTHKEATPRLVAAAHAWWASLGLAEPPPDDALQLLLGDIHARAEPLDSTQRREIVNAICHLLARVCVMPEGERAKIARWAAAMAHDSPRH